MSLLHRDAHAHRPPLAPTALKSAWPFAAVICLAFLMQFGIKPMLGDENAFIAKLIIDIATNIMLAVSLTLVNGFTGQFSIGTRRIHGDRRLCLRGHRLLRVRTPLW
jgi:hypothetical protein